MKRFLSLLTVFVLAFALAVPVGATGESNVLMGTWVFNDTITAPSGMISQYNIAYNKNNTLVPNNSFNFLIVTKAGVISGAPSGMSSYKLYDNGNWSYPEFKTITFDGSYTANAEFYNWFVANATQPNCDGSSCPATDVNFDDVCDDCGMTLAYNLRVTPNTYEFVVKHSDSLTLKYSYTETLAGTSFDAVYNDNRITVSFDNPVDHYQYKLNNGEWELNASYPNTIGSHVISLSGGAVIQSSDLNIYDENGDLFFQNPLWMTVEKVTQGEMENLTSETAGTMKTLVVCGVGLMACLMALSLFGKRWLLFLR